jgi:hypothetical protein
MSTALGVRRSAQPLRPIQNQLGGASAYQVSQLELDGGGQPVAPPGPSRSLHQHSERDVSEIAGTHPRKSRNPRKA